MVTITIVSGAYKPTYNWAHIVAILPPAVLPPALLDAFKKGATAETDAARTATQHVDVIHPGLGAEG